MMSKISVVQLEKLLRRENPFWDESAYLYYAKQLFQNIDICLEDVILSFIKDGTQKDYRFNEFSIVEIQRLRQCNYLEALLLLNDYIKDPYKGRLRILHR